MDLIVITLNWLDANIVSAISLAVFFSVVSMTVAVASVVSRESIMRRRTVQPYLVGNADVLNDRRDLDHRDSTDAARMLARAAAHFTPGDARKTVGLRHQLRVAGFLSPQAVGVLYLVRFALGLGLPVAVIVLYPIFAPDTTFVITLILALMATLLGFYLPNAYLDRRVRLIKEKHRQGFPEMLDLLVVCTEAGIGVEAAIDRVGRELTQLYPHLSTQIHLFNLELRAGRSFPEALDRFADHLGIEEARSFATLIQQSQELGTSLVDALRVYSDEMRDKRLARAEEKAHALPAKMVIPLGFFIFPVMLVVTMLPVILRISKVFF